MRMKLLQKSGILETNKYNLESLKEVGTGGSLCDPELIKYFNKYLPNARVTNMYGNINL